METDVVTVVLGFGKGKIELNLSKTQYCPGENVTGKIFLNLKKPISAKGLKVYFVAKKITRTGDGSFKENLVYNSEISIEGEKEYYTNTYSFEFNIPENILVIVNNWLDDKIKNSPDGFMKDMMINAMEKDWVKKRFMVRDEFIIESILEVPKGKDIKEKTLIDIMEK